MPEYTQANRPLQLETVLGPDALLLEGLTGEEGVSAPSLFTLDLLSTEPAIAAADLLRTPALITFVAPDGAERYFHGVVCRFTQGTRSDDGFTAYRAKVASWPWFLSLSSDCRVFQNMSVIEIAEQIFGELGYRDYKNRCLQTPPKREYCVQYRESHLDFVSRLFEEEGIFYFFEHSESKHVLVLADSVSSATYAPGPKAARWMAGGGAAWPDANVVRGFERDDAVSAGAVTLADYDYLNPSLSLLRSVAGEQQGEVYDYPGGYTTPEDGDRYARLKLEQCESELRVVRGTSNCRHFQSGYRFDLKDHYRADANRTYHVLSVRHRARVGGARSGYGVDAAFDYENSFVAIPHDVPYRPPPKTPKPLMRGVQTAVVVGPPGEEIHVDKHGRVKVQFHWDRKGARDEKSSCWVRVSSAWAGKGWGSLAVPRVGQEVIVDFLEGNPDQPIIVGRVYNAEQSPPYDPAKGGAVSGLRSKTHKGSGYNEMSMDDTAGKEKITIHAQYDMSTTVEHDDTQRVVAGNRKIDVVAGTHTETIKGDTTITVTAGKQSNTVNKEISITSQTASIHVKAATQILLEVGASKLLMKSDGSIELKGVALAIDGSSQVNVHGGQVLSKADASHNTEGAIVVSEGKATNTVKGGMVMLNP